MDSNMCYFFYLLLQFPFFLQLCGEIILKPFLYEMEMSPINCSQEIRSKTNGNGYIQSPNYPSAYPNQLFCVYEFFGEVNEHAIIEIEDFELEPPKLISALEPVNSSSRYSEVEKKHIFEAVRNSDDFQALQCFNDYFDIYNYNNIMKYYEFYKRICGTQMKKRFVANSPRFRIIFSSDMNNQYKGFKLKFHFSFINISPFKTDSACGSSNITGDGGILSSPFYPKVFPSIIECAWTITVDESEKILIKFKELNFNEPCTTTYVHIWDGYVNNVDKPDLIACQKLSFYLRGEKYIKAKSNRVVIKFIGRRTEQPGNTAAIAKNGNDKFLFTWSAIREDEKCGENYFKCKGGEFCIDTNKRICSKLQSYCINNKLRCDGNSHCDIGDESDEENCSPSQTQNIFHTRIVIIFFIILIVSFTIIFFGVLIYVIKETNKKSKANLQGHILMKVNKKNSISVGSNENIKLRNAISNQSLVANRKLLSSPLSPTTEFVLLNKKQNENINQEKLKCIEFLDVEVSTLRNNSYTKAISNNL